MVSSSLDAQVSITELKVAGNDLRKSLAQYLEVIKTKVNPWIEAIYPLLGINCVAARFGTRMVEGESPGFWAVVNVTLSRPQLPGL